jgi:hypothetical protein
LFNTKDTLQPIDLNVEVINLVYWHITYPKATMRVTKRDNISLNSDRFLIEDFSKMCAVLKMDSFFNCYAKSLFMRLTTKFFQVRIK